MKRHHLQRHSSTHSCNDTSHTVENTFSKRNIPTFLSIAVGGRNYIGWVGLFWLRGRLTLVCPVPIVFPVPSAPSASPAPRRPPPLVSPATLVPRFRFSRSYCFRFSSPYFPSAPSNFAKPKRSRELGGAPGRKLGAGGERG